MRLFAGCVEVNNETLLVSCDTSHFTLTLRSQQCAEWLDRLSKGFQCDLQDASEEVRASKECVLAAVQQSGQEALMHAPSFQDDKDVVMAAVQNDGLSLFKASWRLRADADVALAAARKDRASLAAVFEPLRSDPEFLRRAYWVSSLDCKPNGREFTNLLGWEKGFTWENVLCEQCGPHLAKFWAVLYDLVLMKRGSIVANMLTIANCFFPFMWSYFGVRVLGHGIWMHIFSLLCVFFLLRRVVARMHVDLVNFMAGPLPSPRGECYRQMPDYCDYAWSAIVNAFSNKCDIVRRLVPRL
jgi:hypothetical protein